MTPSSATLFNAARVERYLARQRSVDGWLSDLDARLITAVAKTQVESGIRGAVGEIGIHHGRLFILLALTLVAGEKAFAIDIFDHQELNPDGSGFGDEAVFRANMARFQVDTDAVAVIKGSSTDILWPDVAQAAALPSGMGARLFSIDGGHTAELTANDLAIADAGLAAEGVIILDDYFNPEFPAVSEGLARYLVAHPDRLRPFAIGDNKVLLARPDQAARYGALLQGALPEHDLRRHSVFFGQPVLVYRTAGTLLDWVRQSSLARKLRNQPIGRRLKPLVRRLLG